MAARLGFGIVIALIFVANFGGSAEAVTPGRNGLLLISAPAGTRFSSQSAVPLARTADCYPGAPDALWTVHADGSHVAPVGAGSGGSFSPGGRTLLINFFPPCYGAKSLSISRSPFRTERSIKAAVGDGAGNAWPGSWLGPERPSAFDDNGRYIDALTGRRLLPGAGYSEAGGGNPPAASCDGRVALSDSPIGSSSAIVSPVRSHGRVLATRRRIVALHTPGYVSAQWSSDGRYLFYVVDRERADSSSLWRVRSDGRGRRLLYTDRFDSDLLASVSPNGRWVLLDVLAPTPASEQLWLIRSDGRGLRRLAAVPAGQDGDVSGEWSPRGDQLFVTEESEALSAGAPQTRAAYVVRPGGGGRRALPALVNAGFPVWSPDERQLAYSEPSTTTAGAWSLEIAPVAGGPPRTVLTAVTPPLGSTDDSQSGLTVSDWQAVPGTARHFRCLDGRPPS